MVTLAEVAREVGCSATAVSRVLNSRQGTQYRISAATEKKIRLAAAKLGYTSNKAAAFLRQGKSSDIGVFLPPYRASYMVDLTMGLTAAASAHNYPLNFSFDCRSDDYLNFLKRNRGRRSCGIITYSLFAFDDITRKLMVDYALDGGKLVIFNSGNPLPEFPELVEAPPVAQIDDYAGGRLAVEYLLSFQPPKVFCIGEIPHRCQGAIDTVRQHGVEFQKYSESEADYHAVVEEVRTNNLPCGIFCDTDLIAVRVHSMLLQAGIVPGQRVHLIGYDDLAPVAALSPRLTTVHQPFRELGEIAMQMLIDLINGQKVEPVTLVPRLEIRET